MKDGCAARALQSALVRKRAAAELINYTGAIMMTGNTGKDERAVVLTSAQREAIYADHRFIAVVAGPGSEKTQVLTERIAHLVRDCGVDPKCILALSFSGKAAGEMSKRLIKTRGPAAAEIRSGTFHSFGLSIIREHAAVLGFSGDIEVLTQTDRNRIIRRIWNEEHKKADFCLFNFEELVSGIGLYKIGVSGVSHEIEVFCEKYNSELRRANCVDFDDMIVLSLKLLAENEDIRKDYQNRYPYIMIDEVQDMNKYQTDIIRLLTGLRSSLFLVGDDDQCIYEWRGAVPDFLKELAGDSKYHVIRLDDNFRSEGAIVSASSSFIEKNVKRIRKALRPKKKSRMNGSAASTYAYRFSCKEDEGAFIAKTISELSDGGLYKLDDFTILVRKHSQIEPIASALDAESIPYHIQGEDPSRFDEFLVFLKSLAFMNCKNNISRIINYPSGIVDNFTYEDLYEQYPHLADLSVPEGLKWLYDQQITFENSDVFYRRYAFLNSLYSRLEQQLVTGILDELLSFYTVNEKQTKATAEKIEKIQSILPLAEDFDRIEWNKKQQDSHLTGFLDYLNLYVQDESNEAGAQNAVNIMTCHRSKGLEFPVVFIPGMQVSQSKEMHPYSFVNGYYTTSADSLEAERRLFYVAMTRAIDKLYITCSADPFSGYGPIVKRGFLAEMSDIVLKQI